MRPLAIGITHVSWKRRLTCTSPNIKYSNPPGQPQKYRPSNRSAAIPLSRSRLASYPSNICGAWVAGRQGARSELKAVPAPSEKVWCAGVGMVCGYRHTHCTPLPLVTPPTTPAYHTRTPHPLPDHHARHTPPPSRVNLGEGAQTSAPQTLAVSCTASVPWSGWETASLAPLLS